MVVGCDGVFVGYMGFEFFECGFVFWVGVVFVD